MTKNIFIAGFTWGLSIVAAGYVGRTWFADANSADSISSAQRNETSANKVSAALPVTPAASVLVTAGNAEITKGEATSYYATMEIPAADRMNKALALDDPMDRISAMIEVIKSLKTPEEYAAALKETSEGGDPRGRSRELSLLMNEWAKKDPKAALAAVEKLGDWQSRVGASSALMAWTKMDPNAAKSWAMEKNKDFKEDEGNWYMTSVIAGLAKQDLNLASTWALEQPRSKARGDMMDKLVDAYTKQRGTAAAQEWVSGLPEGAFRDGATRKVAWRLTEEDPTKAASWISNLPQNDTKYGAMTDLMNRWGEKDPNAAGSWLRNLQPSKETDEPRQSFAWSIREKDPESAIAWAGTISDQKRRDRVLVDLVKDWGKRDQKGAQAYMVKNKWPETARKRAGG